MPTRKTTLLAYNPVSVDKPGTRRWFQSQHKEVKDLVLEIFQTLEITVSKTAQLEVTNLIEKFIKVKVTTKDP